MFQHLLAFLCSTSLHIERQRVLGVFYEQY